MHLTFVSTAILYTLLFFKAWGLFKVTVTEVTLKGKYNTPKRVSRTNTLLKNKKRKKRVWEKWHFERNPPVFAWPTCQYGSMAVLSLTQKRTYNCRPSTYILYYVLVQESSRFLQYQQCIYETNFATYNLHHG